MTLPLTLDAPEIVIFVCAWICLGMAVGHASCGNARGAAGNLVLALVNAGLFLLVRSM